MTFLRRQNPRLALEIETVLEEVIVQFKPNAREELLAAVNALIMKCFQYGSDEVPSSLQITLDRICRKFFAREASLKSAESKVPYSSLT